MADVFISYARENRGFVERLHDALDRDSWVDWEGIPLTVDWWREIQAAIESSDNFLFIISSSSVASEICLRELEHAVGQNKRLIPVVHEEVATEKLPQALRELNWVFVRERDDFDRAVADLVAAIETDFDWVRVHTRLLVRANEWHRGDGDKSRLLRGSDLREAERRLGASAGQHPAPTLLQTQYVAAGRKAATRRQAVTLGAVAFGLVVAVVLAIVALVQRQEAVRAAQAEKAAREEAVARLYAQQLARAAEVCRTDPGRGLELLDDPVRAPIELREFTWKLYSRLCTRYRLVLGGMHNPVAAYAFSPDGELLATTSVREIPASDPTRREVATVSIWRIATGARTATLEIGKETAFSPHVVALAFTPDGRRLATASADSRIRLWRLDTGEVTVISDAAFEVSDLAFVPGGSLAALTSSGLLLFSDLTRAKAEPVVLRDLRGGKLAVLADGETVVAGFHHVTRLKLPAGRVRSRIDLALGIDAAGAVSPDGQWLALGLFDGTIRVWEAASGNEQRTLAGGHAGQVAAVAFSPDGRTIASGGRDHLVRLWDRASGRSFLTLRGAREEVGRLVFSPDGALLAAQSRDGALFLWEVLSGSEPPTLEVAAEPSTRVLAWSPDARKLAAVDGEGGVTLREVASDAGPVALPAPAGGARSIEFAPDGGAFVTTGRDRGIRLWDAGSLQAVTDIDSAALAAATDGRSVLALVADDRLKLWDSTGRERASIEVKWGERLAIFPDGGLAAWAGAGGELGLLDLTTAQPLPSLEWETTLFAVPEKVTALAPSRDGSTLAVGNNRGEVSLWELDGTRRRLNFQAHVSGELETKALGPGVLFSSETKQVGPGVASLALSADRRTLVSGGGLFGGPGEVKLWDTTHGEPLATLATPAGIARSVTLSPDGDRLAVVQVHEEDSFAGAPVVATLWSALFDRQRAILGGHSGAVTALAFSPDGERLVTVGGDGTVRFWDGTTGTQLEVLAADTGSVRSLVATRGGVGVVSVRDRGRAAELRDLVTGERLGELPLHPGPVAAYAPGTGILAFGAGSTLLIFDLPGRRWIREYGTMETALRGAVTSIALSRDGGRLIAGAEEGGVQIWNAASGELLHSAQGGRGSPWSIEETGHRQTVRAVAITADGGIAASLAGYDVDDQPAELRLWNAETGAELWRQDVPSNVATALALSYDGTRVATGGLAGAYDGLPGALHLWSAADGRLLATLTGHRSPVVSLAFSPDGETLASAAADGIVMLWDTRNRSSGAARAVDRLGAIRPTRRRRRAAGSSPRRWRAAAP